MQEPLPQSAAPKPIPRATRSQSTREPPPRKPARAWFPPHCTTTPTATHRVQNAPRTLSSHKLGTAFQILAGSCRGATRAVGAFPAPDDLVSISRRWPASRTKKLRRTTSRFAGTGSNHRTDYDTIASQYERKRGGRLSNAPFIHKRDFLWRGGGYGVRNSEWRSQDMGGAGGSGHGWRGSPYFVPGTRPRTSYSVPRTPHSQLRVTFCHLLFAV